MNEDHLHRPQIKICGLTRTDEARKCAELGADAIGLVFFKKSPRNLDREQAREIVENLPGHVSTVGVFVNETFDFIMDHVNFCGLSAVQLHGTEPPDLVNRLMDTKLTIIKCLYMENEPFLTDADTYNASAYLVECKKGILPGGNALSWNWGRAKDFGKLHPFILAGGLTHETVRTAISEASPDAVDISSGVESSPGRKDMSKVKSFIEQVFQSSHEDSNDRKIVRRIF
ncbi:MAG: phosphoribosylanthranilate isomerase [Proteobacteria bacterium]|nr:phosphoribosylanthranilate isomerase [Pseudomonadota bacterium]